MDVPLAPRWRFLLMTDGVTYQPSRLVAGVSSRFLVEQAVLHSCGGDDALAAVIECP